MEKLLKEWMLVIGMVLLFIAVKHPLLLLMAAVTIIIWKLMAKSTPKPIKGMKENIMKEQTDTSTPAEKSPLKPLREGLELGKMKEGPKNPEPKTSPPPQSERSDAFYAEASKSKAVHNESAK